MRITILNKQECEENYLTYDDKIETTWLHGRLCIYIKAISLSYGYIPIYVPVDNIEYMEVQEESDY